MAIDETRAQAIADAARGKNPNDAVSRRNFEIAQQLVQQALETLEANGVDHQDGNLFAILAHTAAILMATIIEGSDSRVTLYEKGGGELLGDDARLSFHLVEIRELLVVARKLRREMSAVGPAIFDTTMGKGN